MDSYSTPSPDTRRLRVLYFIGSYGPDVMGNASHEETVLAMRARGHDVEVLTQVTRPNGPRSSRATYSGVPVFEVNLAAREGAAGLAARKLSSRFLRYDYLPVLQRAYGKLVSRGRYDLVHVEGAYPFGLVAALSSALAPYVANVQGADVIDLPEADYGYRRFKLPRLGVRLALRRAAHIRVISALLADYLVEERLAGRVRISVVHRALENQAFPPPGVALPDLRRDGRDLLASRYGLGTGRPVILALSRLHPFKGLEYLVDAMPQVVERQLAGGREAPWLLICGPSRSTESFGDYREFLRSRAEKAGVAQHVVFTGQVDHSEVRQHLAGAGILVCPSILEAQNKVVPEACAVGTPSVVTETTGIASYLAPEGACVSVPPRSAGAIADGIIRLLSDPSFYAQVSANALRMAATLRVEAIAPQLERVWLAANR